MKHVSADCMFKGIVHAVAALAAAACACAGAAFGDKPAEAVHAARSVHMRYVPSTREKATGVQATVTVRDTVPGTYFCVACFDMGYCGFQEHFDGSRIFIFSVWDPGNPFNFSADPNAVKEEMRVKCLFAKDGVRIVRFGGEGTGGQAKIPYPWKTGEPETVRVTAEPDGTNRVAFTAWVNKHGTGDEWERIATFSTLHGGKGACIRHASAFIEDFRRNFESAKKTRRADFTNVRFFVGGGTGTSRQVKSGIFTADNSPSRAISAEPAPGGWTLATGGDTPDRADLLNTPMAALPAVCMAQSGRLARYFDDLPAGTDPATISRRVTDQFLTTRPENYKPAGYHGNNGYGWNRIVQYSVVSLWMNAIACARLTGDEYRVNRLVRLFDDFLPGGAKHKVCSRPRHVDDAIFGALPCEIYMQNKDKRCLDMGLMYADTQWCEPCEASFKERESAPPEVQREYYAKGLSVQTRLWIDDMYMITALQSQAYRATGDRKYIERAAAEMIFYLDRLQLKDGPAKGLFYHAPDVPFVWGRGDGWMAAGMALLLDQLPEDSPHRARIMDGYKLMMETLLKYQRKDGLWSQLIDRPDDPRNWGESSCTAMFAYAYLVGVRRGWLDGAKYGPAARRAYDALCARMDKWGNVAGTCEGTSKRNDLAYYFKRRRVNGDPHAQAPMLWIASTLLADGAGEVKGIKTPATSKLFETRVDPESGVVSYALVYGAPDDNRQSLYFITKSMTEDGRFLLFNYTVGNEKKPKRSPKILMVADLLNDTVKPVARAEKISRENIESRTPFVGDPFIECKENYIVFGSPKLGGFFRCDLAEPSRAVKLCGLPKGLDDGEYKADRYYTHLTLTKNRKRAFLDTSLVSAAGKRRWVQGMLDLATGDFDKWGETPFCCNHGQVNPTDDTLAMCAWEACWEKDGQEYRKKTGWYPRMWLMRKGRREMIPAKDRNFASHEIWDDDGKGFSWCGRPGDYVYHHDLATGKQERWCGISGARHNYISPDKKYVVCDDAPERWWRGCKWRVGFWNRETGKHVWLYSTRPALMPQDNQSRLHPDPHPHFVMNAKYVVCTANNADGHMDLYVTPVAQMVKMTNAE